MPTSWNTVGVSPNIIEASWKALVDSIYYFLMKQTSAAPLEAGSR